MSTESIAAEKLVDPLVDDVKVTVRNDGEA